MKVIITATGNTLDSKFDLRFGRAAWFCIYDSETKSTEFLENENSNSNGGAGPKAAEQVAELEITKVISGHFGPKAQTQLEQFNIQMITFNEKENSVQGIIDKIKMN